MAQQGKYILIVMIILSIVGLLTSIYLTYTHYEPPLGGSGCDFSESISCSLVNTSIYSEVFGVSVALFGALWFIFYIWITCKALPNPKKYVLTLLMMDTLGILSMFYLITAEIILQALCPYCTLVHVIIVTLLILTIVLMKKFKIKFSFKNMLFQSRSWLFGLVVISLLLILAFNVQFGEKKNYDNLAKCMNEKGVLMYGSFRCGVCAKTRAMFGDSFQYIKEIECHPQGENPQTELCLAKRIEATPTWMMEVDGREIKRFVGFMDIEELQTFSGC